MQQGRHLQLVCAPLDARRGAQAARHRGGEGGGVACYCMVCRECSLRGGHSVEWSCTEEAGGPRAPTLNQARGSASLDIVKRAEK